jgi:hypothetical protein
MLRGASKLGAVVVAVATACWLTALAAGELPQGPPNFKVSTSGPVGFGVDPVTCPGGFVITSSAPASGTHIGGQGTFSAHECATPDYTTGVNHVDGEGVFTSTDGAQIFFHYGGTSPLPDIATGVISEQLAFSITGGSGRFSGATGGGVLRTHGNFYVSVTGEYDGTIKLHG